MRILVLTFAAIVVGVSAANAVSIGDEIDSLSFKDIRYLPRTLEDFGDVDAFVCLVFSSDCDTSVAAMQPFAELESKYQSHDVQFAALNTGHSDSIQHMAWMALEREVFYPTLKDRDGVCAAALGVDRYATVVVLDDTRRLQYRGGLDGAEGALQAVLDGETVDAPDSASSGAPIVIPSLPEPTGEITWSEHIAPVMNKHCVSCHRAEGQGPFGLTSYKKVAAYAEMVGEVMTEGRMPPWYAHPEFGEFREDRRVPHNERLLVQQWIAGGKLEGDPELAPPLPAPPAEGWQIEPDVIIEAKQMSALPKTGFVPYQYMFLPYAFTDDTYVQAIEIKPSNTKVLHHGNLFFTRGGLNVDEAEDFLTGTVPGGVPSVLDEGNAWLIPKGARLCLQLHYVTTGKLEANRMSVGLRFARGTVDKLLYYKNLDDKGMEIPPHARAYRQVSADTLDEPVTGLGLFGHMHLRGRDVTFYAHYPNGESEVLMTLPNYSFDWQLTYGYPPNKFTFPAGTRVECVAHYDNSAFNAYNPNPDATIRRGPQTVDEMLNGFFVYTLDSQQLNLRVDPATGHAVDQVALNH